MDIAVPTVLKSLSSAGAAIRELTAWRKRVKGDVRMLIGELKDNMLYFDMVSEDGIALGEIIDKISVNEYKRLSKEGFDFNTLQRKKISSHPSLEGSELSPWIGKSTESLIESIYEKINEIKIRYPHTATDNKTRWNVRVNNIRKRTWLLLRHISETQS